MNSLSLLPGAGEAEASDGAEGEREARLQSAAV